MAGGYADNLVVFDMTKPVEVAKIGKIEARVGQRFRKSKDHIIYMTIPPQWSPDSQYILSRWNATTQIHKINEGNVDEDAPALTHGLGGGCCGCSDVKVWDISLSPNGQKLLIGLRSKNGCDDSKTEIWNLQTRQKESEL